MAKIEILWLELISNKKYKDGNISVCLATKEHENSIHYEKMTKDPLPIRTTTSGIREAAASFPGVELNIYDLVFHRGKAVVDSVFEIRRVCLISRLERRSSLCVHSTRIPDFQRTCRPSERKCRSFAMARRFRCADKQITRPRQKRRRMKSSL